MADGGRWKVEGGRWEVSGEGRMGLGVWGKCRAEMEKVKGERLKAKG
ncbi:hypothetical protein D1AOALGA4SA_12826 [Olavius algarvensis Delta 1 endosymbiont]|nr:hypothetical protein D1AOALGA4SA_12826 [Olavius algarvensis Delta 1 endosymbiont]